MFLFNLQVFIALTDSLMIVHSVVYPSVVVVAFSFWPAIRCNEWQFNNTLYHHFWKWTQKANFITIDSITWVLLFGREFKNAKPINQLSLAWRCLSEVGYSAAQGKYLTRQLSSYIPFLIWCLQSHPISIMYHIYNH